MSSPRKPRLGVVTSHSNRDSLTTRNVSSPFSLAIPGRKSKRSSRPASIPLSIRPASSIYSQDQDFDELEDKDKIAPLKPAVIVAERPTRPHPENRQSRALAAYYRQCRLQSGEKRKFRVTCWGIDDRVLAWSVTLTLAFLVVVGVPLVAIIAQKFIVQLPVNVLVPSHTLPGTGSWDRLYDA
jgi:hypothetical protein